MGLVAEPPVGMGGRTVELLDVGTAAGSKRPRACEVDPSGVACVSPLRESASTRGGSGLPNDMGVHSVGDIGRNAINDEARRTVLVHLAHDVSKPARAAPIRERGSVATIRNLPPQQGQTTGSAVARGTIVQTGWSSMPPAVDLAPSSSRITASRALRQPFARKP